MRDGSRGHAGVTQTPSAGGCPACRAPAALQPACLLAAGAAAVCSHPRPIAPVACVVSICLLTGRCDGPVELASPVLVAVRALRCGDGRDTPWFERDRRATC